MSKSQLLQQLSLRLETCIQKWHQEHDAEQKVSVEGSVLATKHASTIRTDLFEVRVHGSGWTIKSHYATPDNFAYRTFASEEKITRESPVHPGKLLTGGISALEKEIAAVTRHQTHSAAHQDSTGVVYVVPVVWFEELCDPLSIWQVVHVTSSKEAYDDMILFYNTHKGVWQSCNGLYFSGPHQWIHKYTPEEVNRICRLLHHAPVFRAVPKKRKADAVASIGTVTAMTDHTSDDRNSTKRVKVSESGDTTTTVPMSVQPRS